MADDCIVINSPRAEEMMIINSPKPRRGEVIPTKLGDDDDDDDDDGIALSSSVKTSSLVTTLATKSSSNLSSYGAARPVAFDVMAPEFRQVSAILP